MKLRFIFLVYIKTYTTSIHHNSILGAIVKIDKSADVDFLFKRELGGKAWENLTENTDPKQLNSEVCLF